jgi:ribosomal protein L37AE/L43A
MLLLDMDATAPATRTLEELLAAWADLHAPAGAAGTCVVCAGETLRVERRGGHAAWACRECGSLLEDAPAA